MHQSTCSSHLGAGGCSESLPIVAVGLCYVRVMTQADACRLTVDGGDAVFCEVTGYGSPGGLTADAILQPETRDAQLESFSSYARGSRGERRRHGQSHAPGTPSSPGSGLAPVTRC